jgi:branched-chain amino acid aminotransferase
MKVIDARSIVHTLQAQQLAAPSPYILFYSSLWEGYTMDPALMVVPFDDHLVHRGDGVFETMKAVEGGVYNLDAHLQRLQRSSYQMGLAIRGGIAAVREKILALLAIAQQPNCSIRVVVSRGPGSMGVSPSQTVGSQLYILIYQPGEPFMMRQPKGASLRKSAVPQKTSIFATAKTCNYLPNVLMRAEAEAWGVDFVVGTDGQGHVTEGATENLGIVSKSGRLVFPPLDSVLAGTTMLRVAELARQLEAQGMITGVIFRPIREEELDTAREILIVGTTLNVVSVVEYESRPVGEGIPGPVGRALDALILEDTQSNDALRACYL